MPAIATRLIAVLPWVPPGMVRGRGGRWRAAWCRRGPRRCLRRQIERQERHQPLQLVVHHSDGEWVRMSCIVSRYMRRSVTSFAV